MEGGRPKGHVGGKGVGSRERGKEERRRRERGERGGWKRGRRREKREEERGGRESEREREGDDGGYASREVPVDCRWSVYLGRDVDQQWLLWPAIMGQEEEEVRK